MGKLKKALKQLKAKEITAVDVERAKGREPNFERKPTTHKSKDKRLADNPPEVVGQVDPTSAKRKATEFVPINVTSSSGKVYKIVIPSAYMKHVPKVWEWDENRYKVAEMLAQGYPKSAIVGHPDVDLKSNMTLYGWLEHPEFREHVEGLTLEAGFANKRERIAQMNRLTQSLYNKLIREIDGLPLTDKSVGAIISGVLQATKQIAQEKEEFVEQSKVEQQTNIKGTVAHVEMDIDAYMNSLDATERAQLEAEFDKIGDTIIRTLTGE